MSNVSKGDGADRVTEAKKPLTSTGGIAAKASQPTGVQKASQANKKHTILADKDKNKSSDLKRPASVSSMSGKAQKKRVNSSGSSRRSSKQNVGVGVDDNSAPGQEEGVKIEKITQTTKVTKRASDGTSWEEVVKKTEEVPKTAQSQPAQSRLSTRLIQEIQRMDDEEATDQLMVSEYVYEIMDYMKDLEEKTMPNPNYMEHQKDLEWRMRGVLIDWLLEVHARFHLLPETFYLTVNIIDRFLSQKVVQLERLQLVGVTAMFIASKYEEVLSPHIQNFVHVADDGFTEAEILSAERYMLATLDYDLSFANPMHFMRRVSKADNYDIQTRTIAKYLLEISLLEHRLMEFKPSVNAAAAMYLSRVILEKGGWDELYVHYSGYTEDDIGAAVNIMIDYLAGPVVHNAFYKKYAGKRFLKGVSTS